MVPEDLYSSLKVTVKDKVRNHKYTKQQIRSETSEGEKLKPWDLKICMWCTSVTCCGCGHQMASWPIFQSGGFPKNLPSRAFSLLCAPAVLSFWSYWSICIKNNLERQWIAWNIEYADVAKFLLHSSAKDAQALLGNPNGVYSWLVN